jgi:hypothetical protein
VILIHLIRTVNNVVGNANIVKLHIITASSAIVITLFMVLLLLVNAYLAILKKIVNANVRFYYIINLFVVCDS